MFHLFKTWSYHRKPWFVLALSSIAFELAALYFQYGKKLDPCVMCIYERTAMLGILISALIALISPQNIVFRFIGAIGFVVASSSGLTLAWQHTQIQLHPSPFDVCSPYAHFPAWLKLDQWFPWMFQPKGDCSVIVWQMFNWSMPQWLILSFVIYLLIAVMVLFSQFRGR
ncbi:disulfide bond formation protein DsbB [Celerinatantimonas sp. YJH-8]|uniref:disulfide bond formation protein DsbB n=1 Tax=Celerinatantimonas sp. YJH-8 TaxID=3228714 RepID=UPI0038C50D15